MYSVNMKAPELPTKIYFTILDMGSGYVYTPSLDDNGGTEYIRKDALIEWLEGRMTVEGATEGIVGGYDMALKDVIEHLKEM
jgi:hypothetical protein